MRNFAKALRNKKNLILLLLTFQSTCAQKFQELQKRNQKILESTIQQLEDKLDLKLIDPQAAQVSTTATKVKAGAFGGKFQVPTFDIQYNQSNYVEVLRCLDRYRSDLEFLITQANSDPKELERTWKQDIWADMLACKIVMLRTSATTIQDKAAENGKFFYILNPCISATFSTTGQDACSYQLVTTNSIQYKQSLSSEFLMKAQELQDAEGDYEALFSQLIILNQRLERAKKSCLINTQDNAKSAKQAKDISNKIWLSMSTGGAVIAGGLASRRGGIGYFAVAAGLVAGAAAVGSALTSNLIKNKGIPKECDSADKIAKEILDFNSKNGLADAQSKLVSISEELSQLNSDFAGYDKIIANESGL